MSRRKPSGVTVTVRVEIEDDDGRSLGEAHGYATVDPTDDKHQDSVRWARVLDNYCRDWAPDEYTRQTGVELTRYDEQAIESAYRFLRGQQRFAGSLAKGGLRVDDETIDALAGEVAS